MKELLAVRLEIGTIFLRANSVREGICVDPPLCRGTSQGIYGLRIIGLVCKGDTIGQIREVGEKVERELVLVVNVRCGKE